ncbi:uncharacterized protein EV422DRAFT_502705 [Fimicolochytrium jonesii]|uniref:uncharacterized protein n=1 Tax=Fimicolochytrium jonesii TaxID=1396493 RepID=UPI0022FF0C24|nr:uncharacterized protein EV422DRAFT_502705 [Fimicolochytrium jonesii]KAI8826986.1 hypothetical protein EV422DRAFT_502705 [Fimicolochytrium jonesii]
MATIGGLSISSSTLTADDSTGHPRLPTHWSTTSLSGKHAISWTVTNTFLPNAVSRELPTTCCAAYLCTLTILRLRIKCCHALGEKRMPETDIDFALEDLEHLLATGIFPIEEILPDVVDDLRNMKAQAKLVKARLSYALPMQAAPQRRKNGKRKKKQPATNNDLMVTPAEKLVSLGVAKDAVFADDGCTICLTAWSSPRSPWQRFTRFSHASTPVVARVSLASTRRRSKFPFAYVLCRAALPDSLVTTLANVRIQRNLVPALKDLPHHLSESDGDDRRRLLTSLLTAHESVLAQVTAILFSMVGVVSTTAAKTPATAPLLLQSDHPDWKATFARAHVVSDALEKARDNAAADIYEHLTSIQYKRRRQDGRSDGRGAVHVDLQGLHRVHVITGKGSPSKDGEGVLRELVKICQPKRALVLLPSSIKAESRWGSFSKTQRYNRATGMRFEEVCTAKLSTGAWNIETEGRGVIPTLG